MFFRRQWGTVCDDDWNINSAQVACRELGYLGARQALHGGQVPRGVGQIWLDNVRCTGRESNLSSCSHAGLGNNDCSHSEDAGVVCSSEGKCTTRFFTTKFCHWRHIYCTIHSTKTLFAFHCSS